MYQRPNYIIQIESSLSKKEISKLEAYLEENLISYSFSTGNKFLESEFANEIYEEIAIGKAEDMMEE